MRHLHDSRDVLMVLTPEETAFVWARRLRPLGWLTWQGWNDPFVLYRCARLKGHAPSWAEGYEHVWAERALIALTRLGCEHRDLQLLCADGWVSAVSRSVGDALPVRRAARPVRLDGAVQTMRRAIMAGDKNPS